MLASEVFGIRTEISEHSYVDRGQLDSLVGSLAARNQHIALKGESKSGKSWLRQGIFPKANVIQCRISDTVENIYRQILANLDVLIRTEVNSSGGGIINFEATGEAGWSFLAKASGKLAAEGTYSHETISRPVGRDELDLEFIASIVKASGRRVVIEDFHYLSTEPQRVIAHDLKTLWDYGVYVVVVGIWHRKNYLTYLNSDLAGRIAEVNVDWNESELKDSMQKGCAALNVHVHSDLVNRIAKISYSNIGILQSLALNFMDVCGVRNRQEKTVELYDASKLDYAGMLYAEQLEAVYSLFAERVSEGIRRRKNATQIYALSLWSVMEATDQELLSGLTLDWIFNRTHERQPRIQKSNLRTVLRKFKSLQEDDRGKGIVLSYDDATDTLVLIDKGLLFFRTYTTATWPWERIAREEQDANTGLSDEED